MDPGEAFTLELTGPVKKGTVKFFYNSGYYKWLKIETSADGDNWKNINVEEKNWQQAKFDFNQPVKFVRISNKKDELIDLRLFEFSVTEAREEGDQESYLVHDQDVFTATELKAGEALVEKSSAAETSEIIILTDADDVALQLEGREKDGSWEEFPDSYQGKLMQVDLPKTYKAIRIKAQKKLKIYEVIWK